MPRKPPPPQWGNKHRLGKPLPPEKKVKLPKERRERVAKLLAEAAAKPPGPHPGEERAMSNPFNVQPGQVWVNVDPRAGTNHPLAWKAGPVAVKVHRVEPPYALCYWVGLDGVLDLKGELRSSRIRLDLFFESHVGRGHRGWRLK